MKVFSAKPRKDGKYMVTIGFDNGRRYRKILTKEETERYIKESRELTPHKTPFDK